MSWIRLVNGRPAYTGRLPPPKSFDAWAARAGKPLVDAVAARRRFALFGRRRAAKRDLWTMVRTAAERGPLAEALAAAVNGYLPTVIEVARLPDMPYAVASLRRIVVVPRVVCNATTADLIAAAIDGGVVDLHGVEHGELLRDYVSRELVAAVDQAVMGAAAGGRRAMAAGGEWMIVDADREFSWWIPFTGETPDEWRGHYVLYEAPSGKLTRAARKDVSRTIAWIYERLPALSRQQRNDVVTQASARMRETTARAMARARGV